METLRALQQRLAAEILRPVAGAESLDDGFARRLRLPVGVSADDRLAVYRDGYPARILEAVRDVYPAIANICGEGSFAGLVRRYLRDRDVSRDTLNRVGRQFADHCRTDPLSDDLPFLADLARLEWTVLEAFHSRERSPVDPAAFSAFDMDDWERVVFAFQPSMRLEESPWPIADLWACRDTPREQIDVDLTDRAQQVLVHRTGYDVDCTALGSGEAAVLGPLLEGAPLGEAIEVGAASAGPDDDFERMFTAWLAAGWVVSVSLPER